MDRLNKISLLEQLKNGQITLEQFKRQFNGNKLPVMVYWERENLYRYIDGNLYTKEQISELEKDNSDLPVIFIEPASQYLEVGKNLKELLK